MLHFGRHDISAKFSSQDWQSIVFKEFEAQLLSETRPFPCIYGVAGLKADSLRFAFCDEINAANLAKILNAYLVQARAYGQNTSLVVFYKPEAIRDLEAYQSQFWQLLSDVVLHDEDDWPEDIPKEIDHPQWEFCFAKEPMFVVCGTPAHALRQSRRSSTFMLTFQPRWVFDGILETEESTSKAFQKVRGRLSDFDLVALSPALGRYGSADNREYQQYFLDEENNRPQCPFKSMPNPISLVKKQLEFGA